MKKYNLAFEKQMKKVCGIHTGSPIRINSLKNIKGVSDDLHYHPKGHEFYIILTGKIIIEINNEKIIASNGDVVQVYPGEIHRVIETLEDSNVIVVRQEFNEDDKIILEKGANYL